MPVKKENKKKILSGLDSIDKDFNSEEIDPQEALEKATDSVVSDLPERKRKKYERKNWGDRPEHLRKPLGEMSQEEKAEYYKWKAGEQIENKEESKPAYQEDEIYALGCVILPMLCARMPNPLPPSNEELTGFARVITPLANKYMTAFQYKEEMNAGLFALAFILPRAKKTLTEVPLENYSG